MDEWASRWWSGRRMPERWRCSSSATSTCSSEDPWLVVPNRSDVERVELDLLRRRPALLAGRIGTFDDLFEHLALSRSDVRPVASGPQRALAVRRAISLTPLDGLSRSAGSRGFADALGAAVGEVEAALLEPDALGGDLGRLAATYRAELDRLGIWDRDRLRRRAVERLSDDLDAWHGEPVFAYGFEDLTGAEWALLEALAGRADVTVSIPYEPGRAAFAALERTVTDLAGLAGGAVEDLPPRHGSTPATPLERIERSLFVDDPEPRVAARRLASLPRGRRRSWDRGAPRVRASPASPLRHACRARRDRLRLRREMAARPRRRVRRPRRPVRRRRAFAARRHRPRGGVALAPPVRVARRWPGGAVRLSYARRSPGSSGARSTSRRAGCAAVPSPTPRRVEEETERLRGAPVPALGELARRVRSRRRRACRPARDGAACLGPRVAAHERRRQRRRPRVPRGRARARRARGVRRSRRTAHHRRGRGRGARAEPRSPARRGRARARRRPRLPPSAHADLRRRLPPRARGGEPPAARAAVSLPRRRRPAGARRSPRAPGPRRLQPLPLLHGVHARDGAARARPRGGDRRRRPSGAEPVLGRRSRALRGRRRRARHAQAAALEPHLAARGCAERARASACRCATGRRRRGRCGRARGGERMVAPARPRPLRLPPTDRADEPGGARLAFLEDGLRRNRARAFRGLLLGLARRPCDRSEEDRRRARSAAPRAGRTRDAQPLLRRSCRRSSARTG